MKRYLPILLVLVLAHWVAPAQNPFDLPMACPTNGGYQDYEVANGLSGSTFTWQLIDPNGNPVPTDKYEVDNDQIRVYWDFTMTGGIYTFKVDELTPYGCTGYWEENIVLNTPTIFIPFDGVPETVSICFGDDAALDPGDDYRSYLWQDGSTNQVFYTGEAGTYQVRLVNSIWTCTYNEIETFVNPLPVVWLGNDTVLFGTQTITLPRYVSDNVMFYNWSTGHHDPTMTFSGSDGNQIISLTVVDANGCMNTDEILISAADYSHLRIPAAFTPNGDGINDTWLFPAPDGTNQHLYTYLNDVDVKVFSRWGKLVWSSEGMFQPWDGKGLNGRDLPMDSYHYIIRINVDDKTYTYKGSVTIVR